MIRDTNLAKRRLVAMEVVADESAVLILAITASVFELRADGPYDTGNIQPLDSNVLFGLFAKW